MFEIGQIVTYATSGVCRIQARETRHVGGMDMEYYILKPLYNPSMTVMVPCGNAELLARMRPALDRESILELIHTMPKTDVYSGLDPELRKEKYTAALKSGDQRALAQMLRSLYGVKQDRRAAGKPLSTYEESAMREAENMLHSEFAHVLGIQLDQVADFIHAELAGEGLA